METNYISQEATIKMFRKAEVLAFEAFNRILTENNIMREQLAAIGKKPGDKMDDVIKLPAFADGESRKWIDVLPVPWWELLKEVQDGKSAQHDDLFGSLRCDGYHVDADFYRANGKRRADND